MQDKNTKNIAQNILKEEGEALILASSKNIDNDFIKAVNICHNAKGKIVIIGVGKSGLIGRKIAATLASTGSSSFFVHPSEAMHGDLGMIDSDDVCILISYSGESSEVVLLLPHITRLGCDIIAMSSNANSTLAKGAKCNINIYVEREAGLLNTAPTTSTTLTLALGDALAVCLMELRGFRLEDFASFHPGGSLGKRLFVKVKDFLIKEKLPIIDENTSIAEALVVMSEGKLGSAIITRSGTTKDKILGVISDGDIRRNIIKNNGINLKDKAINFASKNPKILNDENILAKEALEFLENNKITLLIVAKDDEILGLAHMHDLVSAGIK